MFASMYYQLWWSLVKIVGFVLQFVVLTIRSCQINHQYQRDVLLADFGKFGKSWGNADDYIEQLSKYKLGQGLRHVTYKVKYQTRNLSYYCESIRKHMDSS